MYSKQLTAGSLFIWGELNDHCEE